MSNKHIYKTESLDSNNENPTQAASSSASNVDLHLQTIEENAIAINKDANFRKRLPEEQLFTEEELARLINPDKLELLINHSDDLVSYLTSEIDKFEK